MICTKDGKTAFLGLKEAVRSGRISKKLLDSHVLRILKSLRADLKGSASVENYALALALCLQLGLAQFSGALVRRPNVSIYLSLVLALI